MRSLERVIVTGGKGQLGVELLHVLAGTGRQVIGVDLPELDIAASNCTDNLMALDPDYVVHAAAATDVDRCEQDPAWAFAVNATGTRNVVQACCRTGASLLYFSTDYVFDGKKTTPYLEQDAPAPLGVYGRSKLAGEQAARLAPRWTVVRTAWLYGVHGKNFVKAIRDKAASGGPLRVVNDQFGSPTYAPDLASAVATLIARQLTGVFHLTNSGVCSWFEFARAIVDQAGMSSVPLSPITSMELNRPAPRPAYSVLENAAWRNAGLPALRAWPDALADMIARLPREPPRAGEHLPQI